jgi:hypothetical protein
MNCNFLGNSLATCALAAIVSLAAIPFRALGDEPAKPPTHVSFRDIHREGSVKIIGHFGIPIGTMVKLEGRRAKPSKRSNYLTLHFRSVNDKEVAGDPRYEPYIQIANVDSLPEDQEIVLEGYETIQWSGAPDINWHLDVTFVVTKVIEPKDLKLQSDSAITRP